MSLTIEEITKNTALAGQIMRLARMGKTARDICFNMNLNRSYDVIYEFLVIKGFMKKRDNRTPYTPEETKIIKKQCAYSINQGTNINFPLLASKLDRTEASVRAKAYDMGFKFNHKVRYEITAHEKQQIIEMHSAGVPNKEIAETLSISLGTISNHITRYKRYIFTEEQTDIIKKECARSLDLRQRPDFNKIATLTGRSVSSITAKIYTEGYVFYNSRRKYLPPELAFIRVMTKIPAEELDYKHPSVIAHSNKFGRTPESILQRIRMVRRGKEKSPNRK